MKIPKSFRLGALKFTVEIVPADKWSDEVEEACAYFHPEKRHIALKATDDREALEHAYFHELEHAILHVMNRDRLYKDEPFVDLHSCLLLQALTSAK